MSDPILSTIEFPPQTQEQPVQPANPSPQVTVNFPDSPIVNPPDGAVLWAFGLTVSYINDTGLRSAPIAGILGSEAAFWRVHGGATYKVVTFVAQQIRAAPSCPSPAPANDNEVLKGWMISNCTPGVTPQGDPLFTIVGQYLYECQKPMQPSDAILIPGSPLLVPAYNTIVPQDFLSNLIGPQAPPAGFSGAKVNF